MYHPTDHSSDSVHAPRSAPCIASFARRGSRSSVQAVTNRTVGRSFRSIGEQCTGRFLLGNSLMCLFLRRPQGIAALQSFYSGPISPMEGRNPLRPLSRSAHAWSRPGALLSSCSSPCAHPRLPAARDCGPPVLLQRSTLTRGGTQSLASVVEKRACVEQTRCFALFLLPVMRSPSAIGRKGLRPSSVGDRSRSSSVGGGLRPSRS